jgi:hypothetical protein
MKKGNTEDGVRVNLGDLAVARLEQWTARFPRVWPVVFFPWFAMRMAWASVQIAWWWIYREFQCAAIWLLRTVLVVKHDE